MKLPDLRATSKDQSVTGPSKSLIGKAAATSHGVPKEKTNVSNSQMKLFGSSNPSASSAKPKPRPNDSHKLKTKVLQGIEDDNFSSDEESDDERRGGRRMFPLLLELTKPCRRKGEREKLVRCIGSKGKCLIFVNL